jgi:hypothetical protein
LTTRLDEGPESEPDDPLAVILRPPAGHLGPPPGRYEEIRRTAHRRRLLRTATGAALTCAVAALIALPLHLTASQPARSPVVPLAPPTSGRTPFPSTLPPTPTASASPTPSRPAPVTTRRTDRGRTADRTAEPGTPSSRAVPGARVPSVTPAPEQTGSPTAARTRAAEKRR